MIASEHPTFEPVVDAEERRERERHEALALADRFGLDFVDMDQFRIDNDLFRSIPFDLMLRYEFVPEHQLDGRLSVVRWTSPSSTSSSSHSASRWR